MKVKLLRDWNYRKAGDVVEVFEPTGRNWILNEIAEEVVDRRSVEVDRAVERSADNVETATRKPSHKKS